jgi:hypothetical protein
MMTFVFDSLDCSFVSAAGMFPRSKVLAVMDANTGKVITTLPIGERVDAVAYDPENKQSPDYNM